MPIKPDKFPSKDFPRWESWVKHFKSIVNVNGWNDSQAIVALSTCLRSWAIEEFDTVPRRYREKEIGYESPTLGGPA